VAQSQLHAVERQLVATLEPAGAVLQPAADGVTASAWYVQLWTWLESQSDTMGWVWIFCTALLWMRLLGGWWYARRLTRRASIATEAKFREMCAAWAQRLGIERQVRLLESPGVTEPLTLGFWKPVILFPVGLLTQLTTAQVEALLLHELAHIRRHDYLVNLIQLALEVCFFYHPLFWLISREARSRREFCCDDVVLKHTSQPLLYAKTLTDLQLTFVHTKNQFAMNATGKSHFSERILRIAGITPRHTSRINWLPVLLLPLLALVVSWWPAQAAAHTEAATEKTSVVIAEPVRKAAVAPVPKPLPVAADSAPKGRPIVATSPLKMNVLYIGVDNPLRIAAAGIPASELVPKIGNGGTIDGGDGNYIVRVTEPGELAIRIYHKQGKRETLLDEQVYRVNRIPDPTPKLGGKYTSRTLTLDALLESPTVVAVLENFLFDAGCEVIGYELTIVPAKSDPTVFNVGGATFPQNALALLQSLRQTGGSVFIDDIKVKCPGDIAPRNAGGQAFKFAAAQ
jgi:beta-lactamase regulating signal transducer with metallopeptidase domain